MSYFFPIIDIDKHYLHPHDELIDLNQFSRIYRNGNQVEGYKRDGSNTIRIANCLSDAGAGYVIDCIYKCAPFDRKQFNLIDSGKNSPPDGTNTA